MTEPEVEVFTSMRYGVTNQMTVVYGAVTLQEWKQLDLLQRLYYEAKIRGLV